MPGIRMEVEDKEFEKFKKTIRNLEGFDREGLNQVLGEAMRSSTRQRFKDEEDPKGKKWKKSIRAAEEGGQTLTKSTDLKGSINFKASNEGFVVGTNKVYAGTHQKGGKFTIRAKNKTYLKFYYKDKWRYQKEVDIDMPKREFLGISKEDMEEIKATMEEAIQEYIE